MKHHATLIRCADPLAYVTKPDLVAINFAYDRIGVVEVALITAAAQLRPVNGSEQTLVLQTLFVTHEAQNALLKLFEEPPIGVYFQLVLPPACMLLPTLQSRIGEELVDSALETENLPWGVFIAAAPVDRLAQIDSWQKTKDVHWLQSIVAGVHSLSHSDVPAHTLLIVQMVGERLATRGASNKMLLEHLALALPATLRK